MLRGQAMAQLTHGGGARANHLWSFLAALFAVSFAVNWPWEMLQMPAYTDMSQQPWQHTVLRCTVASIGDGAITLMAFGVGALISPVVRARSTGSKTYVLLASIGAVFAIVIEHVALHAEEWSYNEQMPIVPLLGVGLYPLLQLTVLVPIAYALALRVAGASAVQTRA